MNIGKSFVLLTVLSLLVSCATTKNSLNVLRTEKQLISDIDFTYRKLQKLHPKLYWYVDKKELDHKFDSLKASIRGPMTSGDFYFRLSPVIASIKQGHTAILRPYSKLRSSRFEYEVIDNKLYIVRNNVKSDTIRPGTEVLSVNNIKCPEMIDKYRNVFSPDGFNQTFFNRFFCKTFEIYFGFENNLKDSAVYQLKYNDSIRRFCLYKPGTVQMQTESKKQTSFSEQKNSLTFAESDSSVAIMRIKEFSGSNNLFYWSSFEKIKKAGSETLILDLRDNLGGTIRGAYNLYSYLTDTAFYFIESPEVISRTSILHTGIFRNSSIVGKTVMLAFTPLRFVMKGMMLERINKVNGKYYFDLYEADLGFPRENNFTGKVYVLINGGSFSATCLLASNLKGSKRAVFVGEETGGAFNGTVAGILPRFTLPNSKLILTTGLALIQPHYISDMNGRGIFPDVEIKTSLEDFLQGKDAELDWVLNDISKNRLKQV